MLRPIEGFDPHRVMSSASTTQNGANGKQRVLDAAQALFAEGSFGDIGVALILERAGVQAPTLYHHFGDKEGLFLAWAEQTFKRVQDTIHANTGGDSTIEALTRYATTLLIAVDFDLPQVLRDAPRLQRPESRDIVLGAYMSAVVEPLATILVEAVATGELRAEPLPQMTDVFLGGLLALRGPQMVGGDLAVKASWWCQGFIRGFAAERTARFS